MHCNKTEITTPKKLEKEDKTNQDFSMQVLDFFNKQINQYARRNDVQNCTNLLVALEAIGLKPNADSYNPIMTMFIRRYLHLAFHLT